MLSKLDIHLAKPLINAHILKDYPVSGGMETLSPASFTTLTDSNASVEQLDVERENIQQCCAALQQAVHQINGIYEEVICDSHASIARLSVEIARKVLVQAITDGDYEIQAVIQEALKSAPDTTDIVIRLHPVDLQTVQRLQYDGDVLLENIKLVEDAGVGRCECVVETPKGTVPYRIDEHLEQIHTALASTG